MSFLVFSYPRIQGKRMPSLVFGWLGIRKRRRLGFSFARIVIVIYSGMHTLVDVICSRVHALVDVLGDVASPLSWTNLRNGSIVAHLLHLQKYGDKKRT